MHSVGVELESSIESKFRWSMTRSPPGRTHFSKFFKANFCLLWSPDMSTKWAKELPRQIRASKPPLRRFSMSSVSVSQFASSITGRRNSWGLGKNIVPITPVVECIFLSSRPSLLQSVFQHFVRSIDRRHLEALFQQHDWIDPEKKIRHFISAKITEKTGKNWKIARKFKGRTRWSRWSFKKR